MATKLRLQRHGRKKRPFYHIVVADERSKRDGRFIEKLGTYNPMTSPATIDIDRDKAFDWLMKGAQPTDTVRAILRFKGVLYRKHLTRGVAKGILTEEQATEKYNAWIEAKEAKIAERKAASDAEKSDELKRLFGKIPAIEVPVEEEEVVEEAAPEAEAATEATEEAAPEAEATEPEAPAE